ncbi:MAG: hypothetical protein ACOCQR_01860 [bacterium]
MRLEGIEVKKRRDLGFRNADPQKDKTVFGEPIENGYAVFVKIKDCEQYEKDGHRYYKAKEVDCLPITGHGGTYYAFAPWKKRKSKYGVKIDGKVYYEYYQCTVYFAYKGQVYTGSIKQPINNQTIKRYEREQKLLSQAEEES